MTVLAALVGALSAWLWVGPALAVDERLGAVGRSEPLSSAARVAVDTTWVERSLPRTAVCICSGAAVGMGIGGLPAAVAGVACGALVSWLIARLEAPSVRRRRESIERNLPVAVELLAACALAGHPIETSVDVVASAVGGPLGELLSGHGARVRLGADPVVEWRRMRADLQLAPLARAMLRSLESGAPLADSLDRLADDTRRARAAALQQRARTVGVRAAGPLGFCFLPAFMLVGVVPTVAGGFAHLVL
jgi:Flp pilus assembly protein TadB